MSFNRGLGVYLLGAVVIGVAASCLVTSGALAQTTGGTGAFQPVQTIAQELLTFLTGTFATTAATIAVVVVGFFALTGRMPWSWAFSVVLGIALIFGAAQIVQTLSQASGAG